MLAMYMRSFASASAHGARKAAQKSASLQPMPTCPLALRTGIFLPSGQTQKFSVYGPLSFAVQSAKLSRRIFWSFVSSGCGRNAAAGLAAARSVITTNPSETSLLEFTGAGRNMDSACVETGWRP